MTGQIYAVVGPSGAGKDTLIDGAVAARRDLRRVRRVITRPSDARGEDFEGITEAAFALRKAAGAFAMDWAAHGLHYGIPKDALTGPGDVVFNGSRQALLQAVRLFPALIVVVVTAPDHMLAARLAERGRESAEDIVARLARAPFTLPDGIAARVVMNDSTPQDGVARLLAALQPIRG